MDALAPTKSVEVAELEELFGGGLDPDTPFELADDFVPDLPPAITPRSTRAQRQFAHKAKMEGKKYDRERRAGTIGLGPMRTKADVRRVYGIGSIAGVNRHTGKPHEHARERMRNTMTPLERRQFRASLAEQLGFAS